MALWQLLHGAGEPVHLHLSDDRASNLRGALILDQLADLRGVGVRTHRLVETSGVRHGTLDVPNLLYSPLEAPRDLLVCRLALHLGGELVVSSGHLADLVSHVHGYPYGATLVGNGTLHRLPDPPGGVRGESP